MLTPPARVPVPDCLRCHAYYVTHDPTHPHGCRSFGFQSRSLPRDEVWRSSSKECQLFEPKSRAAKPSP